MDHSGMQVPHAIYRLGEYMRMQRYSNKTIENYQSVLKLFFAKLNITDAKTLQWDHIQRFHKKVILKNNYSSAYQNQLISALKILYHNVLNHTLPLHKLERPRKQRVLPEILSRQEVRMIIDATPNLKHRTILSMIYSCGMRVGEVVQLKIRDIDSDRMVIHIHGAKGAKDRMIGMPPKMLNMLREYYSAFRPRSFLFEGYNHQSYSPRSISKILHRSVHDAGIRKSVTPHTLRHCFATHLLESGTDIHIIQRLLGHANIKTTTLYLHLAQDKITAVRSPFEDL